MGKDQEPAPQLKSKPAEKPRVAADVSTTAAVRSVQLDTGRAVSLTVRDAVAEAERAYADGGMGKAIAAIRRLDDVLDEVAALAKLAPSATIGTDLARVRRSATRLASVLAPEPTLSTFCADVIAKVDQLEPTAAANESKVATPAVPLSTTERTELVVQELAATRAQIDLIVAAHPRTDAEAVKVCAPLHGHLDNARHAALGIDRVSREPLFAEVDAVSTKLDTVERTLVIEPRFAWSPEFAAAFDAENQMRSAVGLPARVRAYTGNFDPKAAAEKVREATKNAETGAHVVELDAAHASPQASIEIINANVQGAYEQMITSMTQFRNNYAEHDPPVVSAIDAIVMGAVGILLDYATAGLGTFLMSGLRKAESAVIRNIADHSVKTVMTVEQETASTVVRKAWGQEIAQKGIGLVFKGGQARAFSPLPNDATGLLGRYVGFTLDGLGGDKTIFAKNLAILGDALKQLSPQALAALAGETEGMARTAVDNLQNRAFVEYEKLKTENAAGARQSDPGQPNKVRDPLLQGPRTSEWGDAELPGALEVGLDVSRDNEVSFDYLRLQGGEPSGRHHLRQRKQTLKDVGLHRVFHVRFAADRLPMQIAPFVSVRDFITFGVGASEGLELETLDEKEWLLVRLFAMGRLVTPLDALALDLAERERTASSPQEIAQQVKMKVDREVSKADAVAKLRSLIAFGDKLTTDKVDA